MPTQDMMGEDGDSFVYEEGLWQLSRDALGL